MRVRALRLLAAVGVVATLSACVTLPDSGPVRQGDPDVTEPGSIALLARLPEPDDGPRQIVEGFLRAAAAGLADDFQIAREFLTGTRKESWNPLARVTVLAGQPELETAPLSSDILVTADASATLDEEGRYTEAVPGATVGLSLELALDDEGRWRIRELPDGALLPEPIFRSLFQQVPLHFVTPDGGALVAETHWFPRQSAETAAVRSLLEGPSPWLAPGAVSRFPRGTRLLSESVPVSGGVAQVDLSRELRGVAEPSRGLMLAQLTETLTGLPSVESVAVTAGGVPLDMSGVPQDLVVDPSVGTNPAVLSDGFLRTVEGTELVPWGETGPVTAPAPSDPAVGYDDGSAVVLSRRTAVVTVPPEGQGSVTLLSGQDELTPPSIDRFGWVWTAPAANEGLALAVQQGARAEVDAEWLSGREVLALRVSREGARALVLSVDGVTMSLEIAAVVRDGAGRPVSLGQPLRIGQRITRASTAVWVDRQTVAVLGQLSEATSDTVLLAVVGGPTSALPAVEDPVDLAAGKGDQLIVVATSSGDLYTRSGLDWTQMVQGVSDPAFPG